MHEESFTLLKLAAKRKKQIIYQQLFIALHRHWRIERKKKNFKTKLRTTEKISTLFIDGIVYG